MMKQPFKIEFDSGCPCTDDEAGALGAGVLATARFALNKAWAPSEPNPLHTNPKRYWIGSLLWRCHIISCLASLLAILPVQKLSRWYLG